MNLIKYPDHFGNKYLERFRLLAALAVPVEMADFGAVFSFSHSEFEKMRRRFPHSGQVEQSGTDFFVTGTLHIDDLPLLILLETQSLLVILPGHFLSE